jgi:hypothetical protein
MSLCDAMSVSKGLMKEENSKIRNMEEQITKLRVGDGESERRGDSLRFPQAILVAQPGTFHH